jgi:glutathione S-transferase
MANYQTCASLPPASASAAYFQKTRFGSEAGFHDALAASNDPTAAGEHFASARKSLKLINTMLVFQHTQGKKFIGGDFSHADAAVFGWYAWSVQFAPEFRTEVWEHEDNKEVKDWVGEMKRLPGWRENDFAEVK